MLSLFWQLSQSDLNCLNWGGLMALDVLAEDPGLVPSIHMAVHNHPSISSSRGSDTHSWLLQYCTHVYPGICSRQNIYLHKIIINIEIHVRITRVILHIQCNTRLCTFIHLPNWAFCLVYTILSVRLYLHLPQFKYNTGKSIESWFEFGSEK